MTAPNAPGGLKLTKEQVAEMEAPNARYRSDLPWPTRIRQIIDDWRTLRAACDAKDAEIARWKSIAKFADVCMTCEGGTKTIDPSCGCTDCLNTGFCEGLSGPTHEAVASAEARLAAMATVTEEDRRKAAHQIALAVQFNDFGRHEENGDWSCTVAQIELFEQVCCKAADAALEAFVTNKTAGGT